MEKWLNDKLKKEKKWIEAEKIRMRNSYDGCDRSVIMAEQSFHTMLNIKNSISKLRKKLTYEYITAP